MKNSVVWLAVLALCACESRDEGIERRAVVERYAEIVHHTYRDTLVEALALRTEIGALIAEPSEGTLIAARNAWLAAREPYGASEVFRFYDGPIDGPGGPESRLNGWPMDEAYIDYVDEDPSAGIINQRSLELTRVLLIDLNEGGSGDVFGRGADFDPDKAIATGYHAVEFLLWGQDRSATGPGARSHLDFVTGENASAPNGDRRARYLELVTDLLVEDLEQLVEAWAPGVENYRARFVAGEPNDRLRLILLASGTLAKAELAGERIDVALTTLDQEDEHSCFSDNTHRDIHQNIQGMLHTYSGDYGEEQGLGIEELLNEVDPALAARMDASLAALVEARTRIPVPFDAAIADPGSDGWREIDRHVGLLFDTGDTIVDVAAALGLGAIEIVLPGEVE